MRAAVHSPAGAGSTRLSQHTNAWRCRCPAAAARCTSSSTSSSSRRSSSSWGLPISSRQRPAMRCRATASDQRTTSEGPLYLSDLITFESEHEAGGDGEAGAGSSSSRSGGSSLDAAVGVQAQQGAADPASRAHDIITRATEVLAAARAALASPGPSGERGSSRGGAALADAPGSSGSSDGGGEPPARQPWSLPSEDQDATRHVLQSALDQMQRSGAKISSPRDDEFFDRPMAGSGGGSRRDRDIRRGRGSSSSSGGGGGGSADDGHGPAPDWATSLLGSDDFGGASFPFPTSGPGGKIKPSAGTAFAEPQLQLHQAAERPSIWGFADESYAPLKLPPAALGLLSQAAMDAEKARAAVLPPLQSVLELTTAFRPPERTAGAGAPAPAEAESSLDTELEGLESADVLSGAVGRALPDGKGRLADGTWFEKKSGVEYGQHGFWKRWQLLKGGNEDGTLEWEETWWEASDWTGMKEMGAEKKGRNTDGAAWREKWSERMEYASEALDCVVERKAHKWAADPTGDEWEEKWGEHYHSSGEVSKFADKWGKNGPNVWHERWGEDYHAGGDACVKWTDKWAERLLPGGAREQWGDKWHEQFAHGRGEKNGEVWSVAANGHRYQRWWGEHHLGGQRVRRFGHSTSGEHWDDTIDMDTYYNPVPHFGFKLALDHSPQLRNVPMMPKTIDDKDPFGGPGLDDL